MLVFTLQEAQALLDMFGGECAEIAIMHLTKQEAEDRGYYARDGAHVASGLYACFADYPEEGMVFLGDDERPLRQSGGSL